MMPSLKTIVVFLIAILIVVIALAFNYSTPLFSAQIETLKTLIILAGSLAILCFIVGQITGNVSQVDKLWSIVPIIYSWIIVIASSFQDRVLLMAILISIWGLRLSYNFGRRGGYSLKFWEGEEDYRWSYLRKDSRLSGKFTWAVFNFIFISFYQMALILYFTLPVLLSWTEVEVPLQLWDYFLLMAGISMIIYESIADQQQYNFFSHKNALKAQQKTLIPPFDKGFNTTGLWAYSRHPNYAAEQGFWIVIYFFSVISTGQWVNWSEGGVLLLVILFWNSSNFSERISSSKYPLYKDYISKTSRYLPLKKIP